MLTAATALNLRRKAHWADHVQWHGDVPLPSWIELSVTDRCNRLCTFCPRIDPGVYPNQNLNMSLTVARRIAAELLDLKYEGAVVLCGYGEPLLHPQLIEIVECFAAVRLELVTNGDRLIPENARALADAGVDYFLVSMYDGPDQEAHFRDVFGAAGLGEDRYLLRDRWHGADKDFGLKLTNRGGTLTTGNQPDADAGHPCHYPSYQMMVDWNGDVLLCVQDWVKRVRFGNVMSQPLLDIWTSAAMRKRRLQLLRGRKGLNPCQTCNADGCLHGKDHALAWTR